MRCENIVPAIVSVLMPEEKMVPEHPNQLVRVAAVLALLGSLIWVQWPINFENFGVASVIIFMAAFMSWVAIEAASYKSDNKIDDNVLSSDVRKINDILALIGKHQFYVLRHKNIETYFPDTDYDGLRRLSYYKEQDIFPFNDDDLQASYEKFCTNADEFFYALFNLYTADGHGRATWRMPGNYWVSDEEYARVRSIVADLNKQASDLADSWEELIRLATTQLKGASEPIRRYEL